MVNNMIFMENIIYPNFPISVNLTQNLMTITPNQEQTDAYTENKNLFELTSNGEKLGNTEYNTNGEIILKIMPINQRVTITDQTADIFTAINVDYDEITDDLKNNLNISLQVYPGPDDSDTSSTAPTYTVGNVPLQKWVNLLLSAYGRSLDIYIDGKLVRTCLLPGVAKIDPSADVYITPNGGFSGWTSTFQYWADSCDPQKAWNIYKKGYGGSWLGNFGKYSVKVSLMEGETEEGSFEI